MFGSAHEIVQQAGLLEAHRIATCNCNQQWNGRGSKKVDLDGAESPRCHLELKNGKRLVDCRKMRDGGVGDGEEKGHVGLDLHGTRVRLNRTCGGLGDSGWS